MFFIKCADNIPGTG